jgi:hypothetical protein
MAVSSEPTRVFGMFGLPPVCPMGRRPYGRDPRLPRACTGLSGYGPARHKNGLLARYGWSRARKTNTVRVLDGIFLVRASLALPRTYLIYFQNT